MADELVFYTNPMSRGRIVRWMLEEVGQPYRTELLDYGTTMKAPDYLAINPMGKVPALAHGDTVVTECAAICAYLADAFPAGRAGAAARRSAARPVLSLAVLRRRAARGGGHQQGAGVRGAGRAQAMVGYGSLADVLAALEAALVGPATISSATASPPPMSMSARTSAGACGSARSRSARPSSATSSA